MWKEELQRPRSWFEVTNLMIFTEQTSVRKEGSILHGWYESTWAVQRHSSESEDIVVGHPDDKCDCRFKCRKQRLRWRLTEDCI